MGQVEQLILIIHSLIALVIVGLILIQQGKGADAGASFGGGSSQTMFGVQGGGNMLTRWTSILVTAFFLTSLTLAYFAKQKTVYSEVDDPFQVEEAAQEIIVDDSELPELDASVTTESVESELPVVEEAVESELPEAAGELPEVPAEEASE